MKNNLKIKSIVQIALMAAVISIYSTLPGIPIPFSPVPITLQTFAICFAPLLLGKDGAISVFIYVLLGAAGLPVFAGAKGGLGIILGPTGGYIIGFIVAAFMIALLKDKLNAYVVTLLTLIPIHIIGSLHLAVVTGMGLKAAFLAGSLPFIPLDIVKAVLTVVIVRLIQPRLASSRI